MSWVESAPGVWKGIGKGSESSGSRTTLGGCHLDLEGPSPRSLKEPNEDFLSNCCSRCSRGTRCLLRILTFSSSVSSSKGFSYPLAGVLVPLPGPPGAGIRIPPMIGVPARLGRCEPGPWMPVLVLDELIGMFLGGILGMGGVPYCIRRARMPGEPEMGEPSRFGLWGVPGRMFTGFVGVDMSVRGGRKKRRRVRRTEPRMHVTPLSCLNLSSGGEFHVWSKHK